MNQLFKNRYRTKGLLWRFYVVLSTEFPLCTSLQTIKINPVLTPLRVHRSNIVSYMGIHWTDFYFLLGYDKGHWVYLWKKKNECNLSNECSYCVILKRIFRKAPPAQRRHPSVRVAPQYGRVDVLRKLNLQ